LGLYGVVTPHLEPVLLLLWAIDAANIHGDIAAAQLNPLLFAGLLPLDRFWLWQGKIYSAALCVKRFEPIVGTFKNWNALSTKGIRFHILGVYVCLYFVA
jgi:hypothetical protein